MSVFGCFTLKVFGIVKRKTIDLVTTANLSYSSVSEGFLGNLMIL
jgi:hypothetical protein